MVPNRFIGSVARGGVLNSTNCMRYISTWSQGENLLIKVIISGHLTSIITKMMWVPMDLLIRSLAIWSMYVMWMFKINKISLCCSIFYTYNNNDIGQFMGDRFKLMKVNSVPAFKSFPWDMHSVFILRSELPKRSKNTKSPQLIIKVQFNLHKILGRKQKPIDNNKNNSSLSHTTWRCMLTNQFHQK